MGLRVETLHPLRELISVTITQRTLHHRNPFVRKGHSLLARFPRLCRRLAADAHCYERLPPVLCNSCPKSGTHLLVQIAEALPGVTNYGSFLASMTSSIRFRERSRNSTLKLIGRIAPAELVTAHLFLDKTYQEALRRLNVVHFLILRDPRDVVVSEAHYLTSMSYWHRLHPHFKRLPSLEERISLAIRGAPSAAIPLDYPDIAHRFNRYTSWLNCAHVFSIRFEDLVSDRRAESVRALVEFYASRSGISVDVQQATQHALDNIRPAASHTFRSGKTGTWRNVFTPRLREEMKIVAGQLLIELGYEEDLSW